MRLALVLLSLACLGGCNMLMTKDPLFTRADGAGAQPLRPGVWDQDATDQCQVDERQPLASWPSCANGFLVGRDQTMTSFGQQGDKRVSNSTHYVMAAGHPMVFQVLLSSSMSQMPLPQLYLYAAVRPTKFDERGRVIALTSWPVLCGPPPPADAKAPDGKSPRSGTLDPVPGLTMDASANDCTTTSQDAARRAAAASEAWTKPDGFTSSHWVRDADR